MPGGHGDRKLRQEGGGAFFDHLDCCGGQATIYGVAIVSRLGTLGGKGACRMLFGVKQVGFDSPPCVVLDRVYERPFAAQEGKGAEWIMSCTGLLRR